MVQSFTRAGYICTVLRAHSALWKNGHECYQRLSLIIVLSPRESATTLNSVYTLRVCVHTCNQRIFLEKLHKQGKLFSLKASDQKGHWNAPLSHYLCVLLGLWRLFPSPPQISSIPSSSIQLTWWQHHIAWETETVTWWEFLQKAYRSVSICLCSVRDIPSSCPLAPFPYQAFG